MMILYICLQSKKTQKKIEVKVKQNNYNNNKIKKLMTNQLIKNNNKINKRDSLLKTTKRSNKLNFKKLIKNYQ